MAIYDEIFTIDKKAAGTAPDMKGVKRIRCAVTRAGQGMEVCLYPVWDTRTAREVKAEAERRRTREAQIRINERNMRRRFWAKLHANFAPRQDLVVTVTFEHAPESDREARGKVAKYLDRLRAYRKRRGLSELKYMYVLEGGTTAAGAPRKRRHAHIVLSGGDALARAEAERLWEHGRVNSRLLQPDSDGLMTGLVRYLTKGHAGKKGFVCSRNLTMPQPEVSDTRFNRRAMTRIAQDMEENAREVLESAFKEYRLIECVVRYSDYASGAYIRAHMARREEKAEDRAAGGGPWSRLRRLTERILGGRNGPRPEGKGGRKGNGRATKKAGATEHDGDAQHPVQPEKAGGYERRRDAGKGD